jgi:hypothetical protein
LLTRNHRQEALCRAYVQAVAALAGVATSVPTPDYGVDLSIRQIEQRGGKHRDGRLQLDLQLRSTTLASVVEQGIRYDLDVATYEFLRELTTIRCILVVLVLPDDEALWLSQSADELILRRCAYWLSLRGAAATSVASRIRVTLPHEQVFSPTALRGMLERLKQGEEL